MSDEEVKKMVVDPEPPGTIRKVEGGGYAIKAMGEGWIICKTDKNLRLADFYRSHHLE